MITSWDRLRYCLFAAMLGNVVLLPSSGTVADEAPPAARRAEITRLRLLLYERIDYPVRLRKLDTEIKIAEARVESLRRLKAEYDRFDDSPALLLTREQANLELLAAELRLEDLKHERLLMKLHDSELKQLRTLEIQEAAARPVRRAPGN